ncbi:MAG TPA: DUF6580 family putative transport protein [Ignavibacteriaceae bacterium]|nr:DUF6580 family putative transport protein [Ignavibacteriaceae bacterium]
MNKNLVNPKFWALTLMILAAAFTRLIPHYPNFTAVGAMALFGGAYFSKKYLAFIVPLAAMLISDLFLGFYSGMWVVYLSFLLIVVIGMQIGQAKKPGRVLLASVTASVSFFLITNFALFPPNIIYPQNLIGIVESYIAAIPFFSYTLLGDLFFVGIMFGAFEIAKTKFPVLAKAEI